MIHWLVLTVMISGTPVELRVDDFRSAKTCQLARVKFAIIHAKETKRTGKKSAIKKAYCVRTAKL